MVATACLQQIEEFGILRSVAVHEDHRGLGLGILAVAAAVVTARDRGLSHVSLFTERAAGFFEKLGYFKAPGTSMTQMYTAGGGLRLAIAKKAIATGEYRYSRFNAPSSLGAWS